MVWHCRNYVCGQKAKQKNCWIKKPPSMPPLLQVAGWLPPMGKVAVVVRWSQRWVYNKKESTHINQVAEVVCSTVIHIPHTPTLPPQWITIQHMLTYLLSPPPFPSPTLCYFSKPFMLFTWFNLTCQFTSLQLFPFLPSTTFPYCHMTLVAWHIILLFSITYLRGSLSNTCAVENTSNCLCQENTTIYGYFAHCYYRIQHESCTHKPQLVIWFHT